MSLKTILPDAQSLKAEQQRRATLLEEASALLNKWCEDGEDLTEWQYLGEFEDYWPLKAFFADKGYEVSDWDEEKIFVRLKPEQEENSPKMWFSSIATWEPPVLPPPLPKLWPRQDIGRQPTYDQVMRELINSPRFVTRL